MTTPLLNASELTMLRFWLNGLPLDTLTDFCDEDVHPATVLADCRARLILKARRLQTDWGEGWLERKARADWLPLTLKRVEWLLGTGDIEPELQQPLTYWLADEWLDKLQPLNVATVADWVGVYQTHTTANWWQAVPGLGAVSAKAVEAQLARPFPEALVKVPPTPPLVTYQTGVVPLEQFLLPESYNGANGENRSPNAPFIPASDDYQAIFCWLVRLDSGSHTYRSYRREAERLLLWTILVKQKALSSLNVVDLSEYRSFLGDPQPQALWIGSPQKKGHAHWKPFTGPLSSRSRKFSETVLNGLFAFLVSQRYLAHNPFLALPKLKSPNGQQAMDINRSFTESQWRLITTFLDSRVDAASGPEQLKWLRTRLVIQLGYGTGLRLHEMAQATLGDLAGKQRQGKTQYWLAVLGKGQKMREVPVPFPLYLLLTESYQQLTGRQLNRPSPDYPLIPPLRGSESKPLTPLALHKILKQAFALAAEDLANEQPETAEKLQYASAHWLRHTHGSTAVDRNIPLTMIRDNLGHSSIATTSHYVHADKDARHEAFSEGFSGK
ncbi:MAG: hypothetical protein CTY16_08110 [Methylobacter sp.]|nr:MAG: hypothetical protein CTY16_08110 [Methylobacter sp.]